eukprot:5873482-Pleurochrysis_carterae.AAC.1
MRERERNSESGSERAHESCAGVREGRMDGWMNGEQGRGYGREEERRAEMRNGETLGGRKREKWMQGGSGGVSDVEREEEQRASAARCHGSCASHRERFKSVEQRNTLRFVREQVCHLKNASAHATEAMARIHQQASVMFYVLKRSFPRITTSTLKRQQQRLLSKVCQADAPSFSRFPSRALRQISVRSRPCQRAPEMSRGRPPRRSRRACVVDGAGQRGHALARVPRAMHARASWCKHRRSRLLL